MIIARLNGRDAFNASYFFGFFFNLFTIYWVGLVTPPGMIAAVALVASYYAVILYLFNRIYSINKIAAMIALPMLWVSVEYFRTLTQLAFPWSDLGYTQSYYLYILQIVSVISVHGLSLLIVTVNVLLWQLFRRALSPECRVTSGLAAVTIVSGLIIYGWVVVPPYPVEGDYKISLLQGSVPLEVKWWQGNLKHSLDIYDSLTQSVTDNDVNLFIWPETSVPGYISHQPYCRDPVADIARRSGKPHLVGALGAFVSETEEKHFNSCYQFNGRGELTDRYDKVKLVPFSEQVPYQDYLPFLKSEFLRKYLTFIETYDIQWWSDFYPGHGPAKVFELPEATYSVLICFESAFPEYTRQAILDGAQFLVGITNDTWFEQSIGIHMHARIFLTRAVENRTWAVRSANSGLTYIVDKYGRIRSSLEPDEVGVLTGSVRRMDSFSTFTKIGDLAGLFSFLITLSIIGILISAWLIRKFLNVPL